MQKKIEIGKKVKVVANCYIDWSGRIGVLIAIGKQRVVDGNNVKTIKEYIVQFKKPLEWSYFGRKEIALCKKHK